MHRVLVVEDDGDMQDLLFRWFRGQSSTLEATLVASAEAALERLAAGSYETLLTDVFLPGIDGVELLLTVRRLYPSIRVVVMSAFGSPELEAAVLDSGALRFIGKPIDFAELEQVFTQREGGLGGISRLAGDIDLFDLCLLFLFSGRRGGVRVHGERDTGVLTFGEGVLHHVSLGDRTGATAFKTMTEWPSFDFTTLPLAALENWSPNLRVDPAGIVRARQRLRSGRFGDTFSDLQWRGSGVASGLELRDLLRVLVSERKSCAINATSGSRAGVLILRDGKLVDADSGNQEGVAAAKEILSWPHIEIDLRQDPSGVDPSVVGLDLDELLAGDL